MCIELDEMCRINLNEMYCTQLNLHIKLYIKLYINEYTMNLMKYMHCYTQLVH